jgi:hypothetical protein
MAAPTKPANVKKVLGNSEPTTHESGYGVCADPLLTAIRNAQSPRGWVKHVQFLEES